MQLVTRDELELHWERVRRFMDCDALIVLQNADVFYLTGSSQGGVLWFPREGEPVFMVRKSFERARMESRIRHVVKLRRFAEIANYVPSPGRTLGFELDVLPVGMYQQLLKVFPGATIVDGSQPIKQARSVKTAWEIQQIRQAASMLDQAFADIPTQLRPGLAEYELAARIEYVMRMAGHQGLLRVRRFNMELYYGAVSFGESSAYPHAFDGPVGVRGLYPAVPLNGGWRRLEPNEPIMVDVCGGYGGYLADGSRTFSMGPVSQRMKDTHQFLLELNSFLETQLKPGAIPSEIYMSVMDRIATTDFAPYFMGPGENQVGFVAHGVGLELDEIPVIAPKFDEPLVAGVVLAVEPKIFYPDTGGVGTENTYVITDTGCERLTLAPLELVTS